MSRRNLLVTRGHMQPATACALATRSLRRTATRPLRLTYHVDRFARMLARTRAVLALSLLTFEGSDDSEGNRVASVGDAGGTLTRAAARLDVESSSLADALTRRRIFLPTGDAYVKPLDELQAADGSSALAKAVYGRMFDAIVAKLNALISCEVPHEGKAAETPKAFIGILDIFGFESFTVNSFEQL